MVPPLCAAAFHGTNWHHVTPGAFAPLPTSLLSSDPEEAPGNVGERLGLYMYICILYIYINIVIYIIFPSGFLYGKICNITYIYGFYIDCTMKQWNIILNLVVMRERYNERGSHIPDIYIYIYIYIFPIQRGAKELLRVSQASNSSTIIYQKYTKRPRLLVVQ